MTDHRLTMSPAVEEYRKLHEDREHLVGRRLLASLLIIGIGAYSLLAPFENSPLQETIIEYCILFAAGLLQASVLIVRLRMLEKSLKEFVARTESYRTEAGTPVHPSGPAADVPLDRNLPPYFASDEPKSGRRLAYTTLESIWWTSELAERWESWMLALAIFSVSVLVLSIAGLFHLNVHPVYTSRVFRVIVLCLTFIIAGDFAELYFDCRLLLRETRKILRHLASSTGPHVVDKGEVWSHALNYANLVSTCSPVPGILYICYRDTLNASWMEEAKEYRRPSLIP